MMKHIYLYNCVQVYIISCMSEYMCTCIHVKKSSMMYLCINARGYIDVCTSMQKEKQTKRRGSIYALFWTEFFTPSINTNKSVIPQIFMEIACAFSQKL